MKMTEQELQKSEVQRKQERDLRALSQAFRESEERRRKEAENVRLAKGGAPLPIVPKPKEVPEQSPDLVIKELKQFGLEINGLSGMSKNIDMAIASVDRKLQVLIDKITVEFDEERKLRDEERILHDEKRKLMRKLSATMDGLDQYLKNWL